MTKQEEIREEIHKAIRGDADTVVGEPCPYCKATERALQYLHSQDVVIKVDSKDLKAGETYLAYIVEPLINEGGRQ